MSHLSLIDVKGVIRQLFSLIVLQKMVQVGVGLSKFWDPVLGRPDPSIKKAPSPQNLSGVKGREPT
tara:strand:+ start:16213 stop:16410 length:198 start_codon:yes stop_codon:yes gene_type:complete